LIVLRWISSYRLVDDNVGAGIWQQDEATVAAV
jgi:hypothetical protein